MVIYGRQKRRKGLQDLGRYLWQTSRFFAVYVYAATILPFLNGMLALLEVGWLYKYILIHKDSSMAEGRVTGE